MRLNKLLHIRQTADTRLDSLGDSLVVNMRYGGDLQLAHFKTLKTLRAFDMYQNLRMSSIYNKQVNTINKLLL